MDVIPVRVPQIDLKYREKNGTDLFKRTLNHG
jgi:hypothetical protein